MVSIFSNLCLWRRSVCSNLGGIDLENLYRATLTDLHIHSYPTQPHSPAIIAESIVIHTTYAKTNKCFRSNAVVTFTITVFTVFTVMYMYAV